MQISDEHQPALADSLAVLIIDGPNKHHFETWLEDGTLPNLRLMRDEGLSGSVTHIKKFRNERCWNLFLTGHESTDTGSSFDPATYEYVNNAPGYGGQTPFYGEIPGLRVCVFDLVAPLVSGLDGIQLLGWGSELNAFEASSIPVDLMEQVCANHGPDPKMQMAYDVFGGEDAGKKRGFRNPSIYSVDDLRRYTEYLLLAVERRTAIALDLIDRQAWDLYLGLYPETHTANHLFWHIANQYPVDVAASLGTDPLKEVFRAVDRSIGTIAQHVGGDCAMLAMTIDQTGPNRLDVPSMALLPELLWRAEDPEKPALFNQLLTSVPEPTRMDYHRHWKDEIWGLTTPFGKRMLLSPEELTTLGDPLNWNPAQWYRAVWPRMRVFALPNVSDGHIRLNVAGREAQGLVQPEEFTREIERVCDLVNQLVDSRTGEPAVKECLVMRSTPHEAAHIPPDVVVIWSQERPIDCMDHPQLGRLGPVPYFRSGGHFAHGTVIQNSYYVTGKRLKPNLAQAASGSLTDLPATILDIIGVRRNSAINGRSLISTKS